MFTWGEQDLAVSNWACGDVHCLQLCHIMTLVIRRLELWPAFVRTSIFLRNLLLYKTYSSRCGWCKNLRSLCAFVFILRAAMVLTESRLRSTKGVAGVNISALSFSCAAVLCFTAWNIQLMQVSHYIFYKMTTKKARVKSEFYWTPKYEGNTDTTLLNSFQVSVHSCQWGLIVNWWLVPFHPINGIGWSIDKQCYQGIWVTFPWDEGGSIVVTM